MLLLFFLWVIYYHKSFFWTHTQPAFLPLCRWEKPCLLAQQQTEIKATGILD